MHPTQRTLRTIPSSIAKQVLFYLRGDEGFRPSHFHIALLDAAVAADDRNFHKLSQVFPEWMKALALATSGATGYSELQAIAHLGTVTPITNVIRIDDHRVAGL